jgi:hypothetical protein
MVGWEDFKETSKLMEFSGSFPNDQQLTDT